MEYRKQAKKAMNDKISRYTAPLKGSVDASGWEAYDLLNADAKTGMRPVSRRAFKSGGKVDAKPEGKMCGGRADRKKKADGGKLTANSWINRNAKDANQERDGIKHVGGLKDGGRAKRKDGGKVRQKKANGGDPYAENDSGVEPIVPKPKAKPVRPAPKMDSKAMKAMSVADPYEDRPLVERAYAKGGKADHDAHKAIGHAVGAAMRAYHDHEASESAAHEAKEERAARKSGGRIAKAAGGGFGEEMNNPKAKPVKSSGKGSKVPVINITINSEPKAPPMPIPGAPVPAGPPPAMPMSMGAPPAGGPAGGPPPNLGALIGAAGANGPGGPMPPMPRKDGGRTNPMTAGAGSGEGRLEKRDWYGARPARAAGGGLGMTAGSGSGEGRIQKVDAYGKKSY